MESNIFYRRRGWWHVAHKTARDESDKARWHQFFGWPPPLDTVRLTEIFTTTFRVRIADVVDNSNALLRFLR